MPEVGGSVCVSMPLWKQNSFPWRQWLGCKRCAEVAPFYLPRTLGTPGSFSKEFPPWAFLPSATNHHGPGPSAFLSLWPRSLGTSIPNHDEVSGQEFLISHLLQYRLGLEKDLFRSLVLFILILKTPDLNPFVGGKFYAHCLDGEAETSGKARD